MKYVIVGAGPAGVIAAETLRKADPKGDVTVIAGEPEPPYSRMAIPYYLTGKIKEAGTYLRKTKGHYKGLGIKVVHGTVSKLAPKAGKVTLKGGKALAYDRLLIATGASPVKPKIKGIDLPGVHHCWTLDDARQIHKLAKKGANVVLVGAGFIACIILESLVQRGVKLTVVEMQDRMLPRMMDKTGGQLIKRWCEEKGIRVLTSTRVTKIERARAAAKKGKKAGAKKAWLRVSFSKGAAVDADLVVIATGVKSNVEFLKGSGVKVKDGILVDDRLETSVKGVFAAGDVAQGPDFSGGWSVHAVQPTAADHGRIAALNMAGGDVRYKGSLVMNVLDTAGLVSTSYGRWQGVRGGARAERVDPANYKYIRLEFQDDRLIGALSLGRTDHVGVLRGLIQTRVALGPWKEKLLHDPHRLVEAYVARTQ